MNTAAVELSTKLMDDCQCTFSSNYITEGYFSCDSKEITHVIYRAKISSTSYTDSETLIDLIQNWVSSGTASLTLNQLQLYMDPLCVVLINSFSDPLCSFEPLTTEKSTKGTDEIKVSNSTGSINTYIIIILVVVAIAMILLVAIIIAFFLYSKINPGSVKHFALCFCYAMYVCFFRKKNGRYPVGHNLQERPLPPERYAEMSERHHHTAVPNSKAEEADEEMKITPHVVSNDYEALDSLQANSEPPSLATNKDEADPEVKVDLTSL